MGAIKKSDPLVPNTIKGMVFGAKVLKYWVLGPSGRGALSIPRDSASDPEVGPGLPI